MPAGHKPTEVMQEAGAQWSKLTAAKKKKYAARLDGARTSHVCLNKRAIQTKKMKGWQKPKKIGT